MIRFQFVDDHRHTHEVKRMCAVRGIQRSSYYKWRETIADRAASQAADEALVDRIRDHYEEWNHTYGYRRITVGLAEDPDKPTTKGSARIWFYVEGRYVYLERVYTAHPKATDN